MGKQDPKISEIMKELAQLVLKGPGERASPGAAQMSLVLAGSAWNESIGIGNARANTRAARKAIEAEFPRFWDELTLNDIDAMLDELVRYKTTHYRHDRRRILVCGTVNGKIHVEWLPEADPRNTTHWDLHVYGLLRSGNPEGAVRFLRETLGASHKEAKALVESLAATFRNV
jgi:hypothetical protein